MYLASFKSQMLLRSGNFSNFELAHRVAKCTKIDYDFGRRDWGVMATPMQNLGVIGPLGREKRHPATEKRKKIKKQYNLLRVARINKMHKI